MAEASEADCSAPSNEDNQANKKQKKSEKRRGPTTAQYVTKEDDGPYPLQWDEHGCAVGDFKNKYIAYTGALVRSKVKISIDKWGEVDNDIKEKLWTATKKLFMCDEEKREYVLKDCMTKWKNFKTRLTKEYFTKKTKNETSNPPWATYVGIEKEDWEIFKAKRLDKDFKALSDRNRANQQKNEHPHRLGRGGYMKRDEQHMKDQLKKAALSGSSGGVDGAHESETPVISPRPRYERWIDGRTDKKGEIPNPKTKVVANRIAELKEAQSSGEFAPDGSNDILTEALGTPEHGGYVRGLGGKATLTSVFKRKKRSRQSEGMMTFKQAQELALQLSEQVREQTRAEMKEVTLELLKSCGIQIPSHVEMGLIKNNDEMNLINGGTPPNTIPSSCHSVNPIDPDPFANGSKEPKPCELTVFDNNNEFRVVAKGTLCWSQPGELVHGVPLRNEFVKVTILHVNNGEESTPLPVPFFGHELLGDDVKGSWAQWPRNQVKLAQEEHNSPHPKKKMAKVNDKDKQVATKGIDLGSAAGSAHKKNDDDEVPPFLLAKSTILALPRSCKELYNLYKGQDSDFSIDVEFDDEIFHYLNQEKFTTVVDGHDLKQLLDMEWISISCMKIWMRYLQKESKNCDADDIFGFFCPQKLRLFKNRPSALSSYLAHSMYEQRSKEYILAPFFHNHHWMLVVICFKQAKALLFNSLGGGPENVQLKGPLSVAYRSLNIHHGMRRMLSWTVIDCPRPAEGVDCGYYVMKYMQKIILIASLKDSNLQKYFSREPYSQDDMDDVRERWCRFLIDECL